MSRRPECERGLRRLTGKPLFVAMKLRLLLLAVIAGQAAAQTPLPGSIASVQFRLTLSFSQPGTVLKDPDTGRPLPARDALGAPLGGPAYFNKWLIQTNRGSMPDSDEYHEEYVSRIGTRKYGNREFLSDLLQAGLLPRYGNTPHLAGWSIVQATPTFNNKVPVTGASRFYAVHQTEGDVIDLNGVIFRGYPDTSSSGYAANVNYHYTERYQYATDTTSTTETDQSSWKSTRIYYIDFSGQPFDESEAFVGLARMEGVFTSSERLTSLGGLLNRVPVYAVGATQLTGISGQGPVYDDENDTRAVIEGAISTAPGRIQTDVGYFPGIANE
jgi:hypothetical protein